MLPDPSVEISKTKGVAFRFVRIWIPSEKEKDVRVTGERGRLASSGAEVLNEPDTESSVVYGLITVVKWCPKYR
jgi:hypothetical protein